VGALGTAAFFADLGSGGEMNVQRKEKNEQQRRDTDDASKLVRVRGQRRQHVKNLAQSVYRCQRAPEAVGIIGRVPDAQAIAPPLPLASLSSFYSHPA
jgi:hypothetical protein